MSPGADGTVKTDLKLETSLKELLRAIEKANPTEKQLYRLFAPVRWRIWRKLVQRWIIGICCVVAVSLAIYYIPMVSWHATAIGRLVMIELLPYWDWTPLYRAKCLISKSREVTHANKPDGHVVFPEDCFVCQTVETVTSRENLTYEVLLRHHLIRKVPVVVRDAYPPWIENALYGDEWNRFVADVEHLLFSNPCDFRTSLLFKPATARTSSLARMVDLISPAIGNASEPGWFLQFRNCGLRPLKKTRVMFRKPYFYAPQWEPPYTSWVLLSQAYRVAGSSEISPNMAGLVIVNQLREQLQVILRPRTECENRCRPVRLTLREQQSLVFSTTLWSFSYRPAEGNQTSVSFVTETYEDV